MPRLNALKTNYKVNSIGKYIKAYMILADKSQEDVSDELGISQQAYGKKLRNNQFTYEELLTIFQFLGISDEGILDLMKI